MNKQQYLLIKLAEEASEIAQAALKAAQFGMNSYHPETEISNTTQLFTELDDLHGVINLLRNEGVDYWEDGFSVSVKMDKVSSYMKISQSLGLVEE